MTVRMNSGGGGATREEWEGGAGYGAASVDSVPGVGRGQRPFSCRTTATAASANPPSSFSSPSGAPVDKRSVPSPPTPLMIRNDAVEQLQLRFFATRTRELPLKAPLSSQACISGRMLFSSSTCLWSGGPLQAMRSLAAAPFPLELSSSPHSAASRTPLWPHRFTDATLKLYTLLLFLGRRRTTGALPVVDSFSFSSLSLAASFRRLCPPRRSGCG